jgi:ankyrin repeat protein
MGISDAQLMALFTAIAHGDDATALRKLDGAPALATAALRVGASRETPSSFFFDEIRHGVYVGDTALHVAAAAFRTSVVEKLLVLGASTRTKNRRGAEPLHYAVDGIPGEAAWNPKAQTRVIAKLLAAGADPNATDKNGSAPLHRAVRNRCADAVRVLLEGGADRDRANKSGSTPRDLAMQTTGRGGSGSVEAKEQQRQILELLDHR